MASNSNSSTTDTGPNQASQDEGFDELTDSFAASFSVTNATNDTNRPHPNKPLTTKDLRDKSLHPNRLLSPLLLRLWPGYPLVPVLA